MSFILVDKLFLSSTLNKMLLRLLSRANEFTAIAGITNDFKDYLSIVKNQGEEGLCWAYSLTSIIEIKYGIQSGNRLMLDPLTLYNNSVDWFKKHKKMFDEKEYESCFEYREDKGYSQICAVEFMIQSKQEMIQQDGNNSYVYVRNGGISEIKTVKDLISALNEHQVLYSAIDSGLFGYQEQIINDYRESEKLTHALVISGVGKVKGFDGLFVEVLNSWGYDTHYDGLMYVKVADDEKSELHNNLNMFEINMWVDVDRNDEVKYYKELVIGLGILSGVLFIVIVIVGVIVGCKKCKGCKGEDRGVIENELNVVRV